MASLYGTGPYNVNVYSRDPATVNLAVQPVFAAGSLTGGVGIMGNLPVSIPMAASLTGSFMLSQASIAAAVTMAGSPIIGPVWSESEQCPDPGWAPATEFCGA